MSPSLLPRHAQCRQGFLVPLLRSSHRLLITKNRRKGSGSSFCRQWESRIDCPSIDWRQEKRSQKGSAGMKRRQQAGLDFDSLCAQFAGRFFSLEPGWYVSIFEPESRSISHFRSTGERSRFALRVSGGEESASCRSRSSNFAADGEESVFPVMCERSASEIVSTHLPGSSES